MADPIRPLSIDSLGWYTITTTGLCSEIVVQESQLLATAGYLVRRPSGSATPVTRAAGTAFIFKPGKSRMWFATGEAVADIQAVSGSMTFDIVEN